MSETIDEWAAREALSLDAAGWRQAERESLTACEAASNGPPWRWSAQQARALLAFRNKLAEGAFVRCDGNVNCDACCNGDRCDEPRHVSRRSCKLCGGTGALPEPLATEVARVLSEAVAS